MFSQTLSVIAIKRMGILLYWVSFCNPKSIINSFLRIKFVARQRKNTISSRFYYRWVACEFMQTSMEKNTDTLSKFLESTELAHSDQLIASSKKWRGNDMNKESDCSRFICLGCPRQVKEELPNCRRKSSTIVAGKAWTQYHAMWVTLLAAQ